MSDDRAERERFGDVRSMTKFIASMTQTVERHLKQIGDPREVRPHDAEACAEIAKLKGVVGALSGGREIRGRVFDHGFALAAARGGEWDGL
jgi:hypothetical protein